MIRLKNVDSSKKQKSKTMLVNEKYDPIKLYQQYIHNCQTNQKTKQFPPNRPLQYSKNVNGPRVPKSLRPSGTLSTKHHEIIAHGRSKSSIDAKSLNKVRSETTVSKNKPVKNLKDNEYENKVHLEADEIECFFNALRELVGDVFEAKLTDAVNSIVNVLTQKIELMSEKMRRTESHITTSCTELQNKIEHYIEEHTHCVSMKLYQDQQFKNSFHPTEKGENQRKSPVNSEPTVSSKTLSKIPESTNERLDMACPHRECPDTGWIHQAGDSASNTNSSKKSHKLFNHSPFGPFQRFCRNSNLVKEKISKDRIEERDYLGANRIDDAGYETRGNKKSELGIKEFLDTVKNFQCRQPKNTTTSQQGKSNLDSDHNEIDDSSSIDDGLSISSSGEG